MVDGIQETASAFQAEIAPGAAPRNERGQFQPGSKAPVERMFEEQATEGDPNDDDGDPEARSIPDGKRLPEPDDEEGEGSPDDDEREGEGEGEGEGDAEGDDGPKYEVTVDGAPVEVSLKEALDGYIRTETFHQRMNKVSEAAQMVASENQKNQQLRETWLKRSQDLEAEFKVLLPDEPDWDAEFARDPAAAHRLKKQFDGVKGKLETFRAERAKAEQERAQEQILYTNAYAERERAKFIEVNRIPDDATLTKEIASMRKTAMEAGFQDHEVATVYDSRMLTILRKASKYDRMMASKPKAVIPGKGKTLTPGSGNSVRTGTGRKGIDAAQRKLQASGSVDDAAELFKAFIR